MAGHLPGTSRTALTSAHLGRSAWKLSATSEWSSIRATESGMWSIASQVEFDLIWQLILFKGRYGTTLRRLSTLAVEIRVRAARARRSQGTSADGGRFALLCFFIARAGTDYVAKRSPCLTA